MSGSSGIRGYLLQTIVTLLDALKNNDNWESLILEPSIANEKVDVAWYYSNGDIKVAQVKSSQNQISIPNVKEWANELVGSYAASVYELILIGPCSRDVARLGKLGKVIIPIPKALDINAFIEQAAHRLDYYIENRNLPKAPPFTRELIINALVTKLETYSTYGEKLSKRDLYNLLDKWIISTIEARKEVKKKENQLDGMSFKEWIDTLVSFRLSETKNNDSKSILLAEVIKWINQVQPAMKTVDMGLKRVTQRGPISKNEVWKYYSDAKDLEEFLENVIVPPAVLDSHFALRESVRHYRRAFGSLHQFDTDAFSKEMDLATQKAQESKRLFEKIKQFYKDN